MSVENPSKQNTKDFPFLEPRPKNSIMDTTSSAFAQSKIRSEMAHVNKDQNTSPKPKVKARSVIEFPPPPPLVAKSPLNGSPRTSSEVTYRQYDNRTELTNHSDPARPPKIAASAVRDFDNINAITKTPRKVRISTQLNISNSDSRNDKFLDLRISNKSLLTLIATLESTVKEQSDKLSTIPSFEAMVETQQKQFEHLNKVEELITTLTTKMNEQDNEIKTIKNQARTTLFYDPKSLPLKSLPHMIFDRARDDVTILFSVVISLLYTVYIFPVIVIAKTTIQIADKSRERFQGIEKSS
ncbi:2110_t:CDS:2 [Entrophospora sp. SA101]|nr:2110_t:CDS:2 [Entrophospora sp. SA101]CAJ0903713.1 15653_t:CDS:2 [Entrophospora sp. SA101]CAJ0907948.1 6970_t:CDS:2 [Entrophospora sp. SA101]